MSIEAMKTIQKCLKDKMYAHAEMYLAEAIEQAEKQEPKPCQTCEALARTVMMDQTGRDA